MSAVTIFLCGAGSRGRTVFGKFALENPELARVVGVAEPDPKKRALAKQEHNLHDSQVFSDWRDVPRDKALSDVMIVATHDRDHLEPSLAFFEAGYHLLLEKPMASTLKECRQIVEASEKSGAISAVCHVLRYTPYFKKMKQLIDQGTVGKVVTIRHFEPVNYWHFAHSFVRGNWRDSETTSPFILAKCCHDMDILYFLMGQKPTALQSFGSLHYFRPESAPPEATDRCITCPLKEECCYSATRFYGHFLDSQIHAWTLDVLIQDFTREALDKALTEGPYGRCVYRCDNNVCDHQVVNLIFADGATASMTATAFTERPARETEVFGSTGSLKGDGYKIVWTNFKDRTEQVIEIEQTVGHHLGGDDGMLREFFTAVRSGDASGVSTSPTVSLISHEMALLAEKSRLTGQTLEIK